MRICPLRAAPLTRLLFLSSGSCIRASIVLKVISRTALLLIVASMISPYDRLACLNTRRRGAGPPPYVLPGNGTSSPPADTPRRPDNDPEKGSRRYPALTSLLAGLRVGKICKKLQGIICKQIVFAEGLAAAAVESLTSPDATVDHGRSDFQQASLWLKRLKRPATTTRIAELTRSYLILKVRSHSDQRKCEEDAEFSGH